MLDAMTTWLTALTGASRRAGWLLLAVYLAATAAAGWFAATTLKVNTDTSAMIDQSLDFQVRAKNLREAFPEIKTDVAVVLRAPTIDEADAFAGALAARLAGRADFFDGVFAPAADPFFRANGLLYLDTDELETRLAQMSKASGLIETLVKAPTAGQLFGALAENDALAERSELGRETLGSIYAELAAVIEAEARGERRPFSWMGAIAGGGGETVTRTVQVTPKLDFTRLQPAKPALEALRAEIDAVRADNPRVEAFVTGDPALRADELASVATGIELSFVISFISVGALLLFCFRSIPLSLVTLASLVVSIVLTAAFAAAVVGELNLVSVAFTVLMVGLGIDYALHLLLHVQDKRMEGLAAPEALAAATRDVGGGLILACVTTALGFLAFVPTDFEGIAQLGIIAGAGVIIALFVSLTFLPAAIGVTGVKASAPARMRAGPDPFAQAKTGVAIATVVLGALSIFLLPQARFDADQISLRDPKSPSVLGFNLLAQDAETTPYRVTRLVPDEAEAALTADKARALESVRGARTLLNFIPADQDEKLDLISYSAGALAFALDVAEEKSAAPSAEDGARLLKTRLETAYDDASPARRLAVALGAALDQPARFAAIESNIFAYWPALVARLRDQLTADYVEVGTLPDNIKRRYLSSDGQWRVDIIPADDVRDPKALAAFVSSVEAVFPDVGGGAVQSLKAGETIARAMMEASLIALGVITLFLIVLLRRVDDVLLMLFPLALATTLTIAAGVVFNIPFNYANVIVLPLLLGIGVDSGIHLVMRARQHGVEDNAATRRAVFYAALTTIASFGSLMLSNHRGTASMGELLSIAIGFTLLCTLVVLPVALRLVRRGA